ncbi:MAG: hypothetical protein J5I90_21200 [Caldilineales bacterium]|nr:hypothetical protein [Caldilineales bacterium]
MSTQPPVQVIQPQTLEDALRLRAAHAIRDSDGDEIGTTVRWDYSQLAEMTGIHRLGGVLGIGLNTTLAGVAHASLVRVGATCLAEACERIRDPGSTLLSQLDSCETSSLVTLALAALDSEIEMAWLEIGAGIQRAWVGLADCGESSNLWLNVRLRAHGRQSGSALVVTDMPAGMTPLALAAAAVIILDPETGVIGTCRLVLLPALGNPVRLVAAESALNQHALEQATIDAAAQLAQQQSLPLVSIIAPGQPYRTNTTAHLVRQAIDHAGARAVASAY